MSSFDLQLFTLHVASHLVGGETIRRALSSSSSSSSNDESSKSRHLFSWRSPPLAPGNGDGDSVESNGVFATDQHQHRPEERKFKDEESRDASLVFLEVIFDWHHMDSATPALESKSTNTQQQQPLSPQPPTTRTITMQMNALLRMSQDGTGLCVGVAPSGKRVGELRVTLQDLERHFEQISIDVTSTPEIVLATTFANALLAMQSHSNHGGGLPPIPETTAEYASQDRSRACALKSSPDSGDVQACIPLYYQDLQDTATWTIRQPATTTATTTTSLDCSTIPAAAMSMWMRSLTPPTAAQTHILMSASTYTAGVATGDPLLLSAEKSTSTPQKRVPVAPAAAGVDLLTLFQEWRQTPVVKPAALPTADPLHPHAAPEKKHGAVGFLGRESPGATTQDSVPAGGTPAEQKKVVQIKRKHGFTRIPSKKKKTGKLKFAGAD